MTSGPRPAWAVGRPVLASPVPEVVLRVRPVLPLAALAVLAASAAAAEVESDDPGARLRATREWYGTDLVPRSPREGYGPDRVPRSPRIIEAARRERDRYGMGASRTAATVQAQAVGGSSA